jgi:hypothetical protein
MKERDKVWYFAIPLIIAIAIPRLVLYFSPHINFDVGAYNVHHLYWAAFLLVITCIFLIFNYINKITIVLAGVSSGLVLDEIIYLIATDGSDLSYLTATSFWGMIIFVILTLVILGGVYYAKQKR